MMELSVVIPAYNEEEGIGETLDKIKRALDGFAEYEILVVDDGSKDRTAEIAKDRARVIKHPHNRGYGAAIKTAVENSRHELICLLDADCTYPPEDIPKLVGHYKGDGDIVSGSRFLGKNAGMPMVRKIGNLFFTSLTSLLLLRRVYDISSGMKVFSKKTFNLLQPLPDTLDMMLVITIRSIRKGLNFKEVPIDYRGRVGSSKLNALREGLRFLRTVLTVSLLG